MKIALRPSVIVFVEIQLSDVEREFRHRQSATDAQLEQNFVETNNPILSIVFRGLVAVLIMYPHVGFIHQEVGSKVIG